jgi:flagellar hook-length control protein FliK
MRIQQAKTLTQQEQQQQQQQQQSEEHQGQGNNKKQKTKPYVTAWFVRLSIRIFIKTKYLL